MRLRPSGPQSASGKLLDIDLDASPAGESDSPGRLIRDAKLKHSRLAAFDCPQRQRAARSIRSTVRPVPEMISTCPTTMSGPLGLGLIERGPSRLASAALELPVGSPEAMKLAAACD